MWATEGSFDLRLTYGRADLQLLDIYGTPIVIGGQSHDGLLKMHPNVKRLSFSSKKWLKRIRMLAIQNDTQSRARIYDLCFWASKG